MGCVRRKRVSGASGYSSMMSLERTLKPIFIGAVPIIRNALGGGEVYMTLQLFLRYVQGEGGSFRSKIVLRNIGTAPSRCQLRIKFRYIFAEHFPVRDNRLFPIALRKQKNDKPFNHECPQLSLTFTKEKQQSNGNPFQIIYIINYASKDMNP